MFYLTAAGQPAVSYSAGQGWQSAALPGAGGYEAAAAGSTAQTPQLATGLAYYAVHGALPPGVTALPAAAGPQYPAPDPRRDQRGDAGRLR